MKPALILCPGLMCDDAVWAPQLPALSASHDCIVMDYGQRSSLGDMARQVLEMAPTGMFALAGHSMGGRVALEVLRLAPQRVSHLALLDTGISPLAEGEPGAKEQAGRLALVALAKEQGMRVMGRQWLVNMVHPDVLGTALFESILDMLERSSPAQFAAQTHALLARPDATVVLPTISGPTLVLTGEQDLWSPPAQHAAISRAIRGAVLEVISHSSHMTTLEQPEAVSNAMVRWLQR
jgi:pimeloyl-ACP methyl ester carboxylesterase